MAKPLLQSIPASSVYYMKAKQDLDQITQNYQVAAYLTKAQNFYRDGNIPDALKQVATGLQNNAENQSLLTLQTHLRQMGTLIDPLNTAKAMSQPDDVNALLQYRKACTDIISLEPDPLNAIRKSAQDTLSQITDKLTQASQAAVAKAATLSQGGDRKEALRLYNLAVQATPDNQDYATQRDQLKQQIVSDCRELYQKGIVHEDLGQTDMAKQAFQQIINIGIPNEDYYQRAQRKLKGYSQ
jgi:tetratricopeptide (TPR) repeat protein